MNFVKLLTIVCCVMVVNISHSQVKGKSPKGKATSTADTAKPVVNQVVATLPTQWSLLSVDLMGKYDFNKYYPVDYNQP